MAAIYKVLSALLSYPDAPLQAAAGELRDVIAHERALPSETRLALAHLVNDIADRDLIDAQSRYVDLFDRTRVLSLHLFEHVHGESRDRGQAMVSLLERYREAGLDIAANELPDHVPVFLEFLAMQRPEAARALLAEPVHILAALGERLKKRGSAYAAIFEALVALSKAQPDREILAALRETTNSRTRTIWRRWIASGKKPRCASVRTTPSRANARVPTTSCGACRRRRRRGNKEPDNERLDQHGPVRHLSLYLPVGAGRWQPDPLRPRAIQLAQPVQPASAAAPTCVGQQSVSCRHTGDSVRSCRRALDAGCGVRGAGHFPYRQAAHRRHRRRGGRADLPDRPCYAAASTPVRMRASASILRRPISRFWCCCWRSFCSGSARSSSRFSIWTAPKWWR